MKDLDSSTPAETTSPLAPEILRSPALSVMGVSKAFGHVQALSDVSFELFPGEILALLGDNGAGKSTLIKILSGVYDPSEGHMEVKSQPVRFKGPRDAAQAGVATVYQDLALVETRDVAANLFLGQEPTRGLFVDRRRALREAQSAIDRISLRLPSVRVPVSSLSGGQRQAVAVARAVMQGAEILIMDEPTAALGVQESARVMSLAGTLRDQGKAVLVISHNLQQIWTVADRFMVLHLGRVAGIRSKQDVSVDEIVRLIVYGRDQDDDSGRGMHER